MFKGLIGHRVIVNGTGGQAWTGTVASQTRREVRLSDWEYSDPATPTTPQDGIVRLPLSSVAWIIEVP